MFARYSRTFPLAWLTSSSDLTGSGYTAMSSRATLGFRSSRRIATPPGGRSRRSASTVAALNATNSALSARAT